MMHKPAEHLRPGDILTRGFLVTTTPEVNDQHGVTATVVALWHRWHLNDMQSGCIHQESRYQADARERPAWNNEYTGSTGDTLSGPCAECGYRYGTAWLYEPLPDDILDQIEAAAKEPAHA